MSHMKFLFLLALVIFSAGISLWVGYMALEAGSFDGSVWRAVLPLLLLGSLALRILLKGHSE